MKSLTCFVLLLALVSCVGGQEKVTAAGGTGGNPNAPQKWPLNAFPRTLYLSSSFSTQEATELKNAATSWSTHVANGANFFNVPVSTVADKSGVANLDSLLDNTMAIYKATTWNHELPPTALAVTQIFGVRQAVGTTNEYIQIIEADVLINWSYAYYPTVTSGYDLFSVALHELGHFLGLSHVYNYALDSVMFTTLGTATAFTQPGHDDVTKLRSKYALGALMPANSGAVYEAAMPQEEELSMEDVWSSGRGVRIHMEMHADGTCVHKENGKVTTSHPHFLGHNF